MSENLYVTSQITKQMVIYDLANFKVMPEIDGLYFLYMAVNALRHDSGVNDEPLKKYFGPKYDVAAKKLSEIGKLLGSTKIYYDRMKQETIDSEDITNPYFLRYRKEMTRVCEHIPFIMLCFHITFDATDMKHWKINSNAVASAKQTYRKLKIDDKDVTGFAAKREVGGI